MSGKNLSSNTMWGGRFSSGPDSVMEAINASISFDKRMARQDVEGSRAHAEMLAKQGIITDTDAEVIMQGLLTVMSEIEAGTFQYSIALEDIHMNVEARLKESGQAAAIRTQRLCLKRERSPPSFRRRCRTCGRCRSE